MSAPRLLALTLVLWLVTWPVLAQPAPIIATWQTITQAQVAADSTLPSLPAATTPIGSGITALALARNGVNWASAANAFNSSHWPNNLDLTRFLSWGFDTTTPYQLTELVIRLQRSGTGPQNYRIDMSRDGGAFATIHSGTLPVADTLVPVTIDLANAPATTSVRFRLYAWNRQRAPGTLQVQNAPPAASPTVEGRGIVIRGRVMAAELQAEKSVMVFSEDGSGCADLNASPPAAPENPAAIPGACVQYMISVRNTGPVAAANITLVDPLPGTLTLRAAALGSNWGAGTNLAFIQDCSGPGCAVEISNGIIPANSTATLTVRATIN